MGSRHSRPGTNLLGGPGRQLSELRLAPDPGQLALPAGTAGGHISTQGMRGDVSTALSQMPPACRAAAAQEPGLKGMVLGTLQGQPQKQLSERTVSSAQEGASGLRTPASAPHRRAPSHREPEDSRGHQSGRTGPGWCRRHSWGHSRAAPHLLFLLGDPPTHCRPSRSLDGRGRTMQSLADPSLSWPQNTLPTTA